MKNLATNILPGVASTVKPFHIRQSIHQDVSFGPPCSKAALLMKSCRQSRGTLLPWTVISSSLRSRPLRSERVGTSGDGRDLRSVTSAGSLPSSLPFFHGMMVLMPTGLLLVPAGSSVALSGMEVILTSVSFLENLGKDEWTRNKAAPVSPTRAAFVGRYPSPPPITKKPPPSIPL